MKKNPYFMALLLYTLFVFFTGNIYSVNMPTATQSTQHTELELLSYKEEIKLFFNTHKDTPLVKSLESYIHSKFPGNQIEEVAQNIKLIDVLEILCQHTIYINQAYLPLPWRHALQYYSSHVKLKSPTNNHYSPGEGCSEE